MSSEAIKKDMQEFEKTLNKIEYESKEYKEAKKIIQELRELLA